MRVQLRRETDPGLVTFHDYLYEVEKINKTISGVVELDLMHFPIDSQGRSILALYVAGAEGTGYLYDVGRNDYTCDDPDNEGNDDPLPTDVGENNLDEPDTDVDLPNPGVDNGTGAGLPTDRPVFPGGTPTTGYPPSGSPTGNNADDPFDTDTPGGGGTIGGIPTDRPLLPGDELIYTPPCCPAEVKMYAIDYDTGIRLQEAPVAIGTAIVGDCEVRFELLSEYLFDTATAFEFTHRCVDPGAPDGYGAENFGGTTPAVGGGVSASFPGTGTYRLVYFIGPFPRFSSATAPFSLYISKKGVPDSDVVECSGTSGRVWRHEETTGVDDIPLYNDSCYIGVYSGQFLGHVQQLIDGNYVTVASLYSG